LAPVLSSLVSVSRVYHGGAPSSDPLALGRITSVIQTTHTINHDHATRRERLMRGCPAVVSSPRASNNWTLAPHNRQNRSTVQPYVEREITKPRPNSPQSRGDKRGRAMRLVKPSCGRTLRGGLAWRNACGREYTPRRRLGLHIPCAARARSRSSKPTAHSISATLPAHRRRRRRRVVRLPTPSRTQPLRNLPQMWSSTTKAMKSRLSTNTVVGPILSPGASSV